MYQEQIFQILKDNNIIVEKQEKYLSGSYLITRYHLNNELGIVIREKTKFLQNFYSIENGVFKTFKDINILLKKLGK